MRQYLFLISLIALSTFGILQFQNCGASGEGTFSYGSNSDSGAEKELEVNCFIDINNPECSGGGGEGPVAGASAPACEGRSTISIPASYAAKKLVCYCYTSANSNARIPKASDVAFIQNGGGFVSNGYGCYPYTTAESKAAQLASNVGNYTQGNSTFCQNNPGKQYQTMCDVFSFDGSNTPSAVEQIGCPRNPSVLRCP